MYRFVGTTRYIWNYEVRCEGTEWFIQDCQLSYHLCSNYEGAGVICEGIYLLVVVTDVHIGYILL